MNGRIWAVGAMLAAGALTGCGGTSAGSGTGDSTEVTFTFTGQTPTAVATKIGTGAFTAVTPGSTVTFEVPEGTTDFSVAYVCPALSSTIGLSTTTVVDESVANASTADGVAYTRACGIGSLATGTTGTLTASVDASALSGTTTINVQASNGSFSDGMVATGTTAELSFPAPEGSSDWVWALAYDEPSASTPDTPLMTLLGARSFEKQAVPGALNGGATVELTAADATTPEPLTFSNLPSGYAAPLMEVGYTPAGQGQGLLLLEGVGATSYPAMPAAAVQSGDAYSFTAITSMSSSSSQSSTGGRREQHLGTGVDRTDGTGHDSLSGGVELYGADGGGAADVRFQLRGIFRFLRDGKDREHHMESVERDAEQHRGDGDAGVRWRGELGCGSGSIWIDGVYC